MSGVERLNKISKDIEKAKKQNEKDINRLNELKGIYDRGDRLANEETMEMDSLSSEVNGYESKLTSLKSTLKEVFNITITAYEKKQQQMIDKVEANKKEIEELKSKRLEIIENIKMEDLTGNPSEAERLRAELAGLEGRISDLETDIAELERDIDDNRKDITHIKETYGKELDEKFKEEPNQEPVKQDKEEKETKQEEKAQEQTNEAQEEKTSEAKETDKDTQTVEEPKQEPVKQGKEEKEINSAPGSTVGTGTTKPQEHTNNEQGMSQAEAEKFIREYLALGIEGRQEYFKKSGKLLKAIEASKENKKFPRNLRKQLIKSIEKDAQGTWKETSVRKKILKKLVGSLSKEGNIKDINVKEMFKYGTKEGIENPENAEALKVLSEINSSFVGDGVNTYNKDQDNQVVKYNKDTEIYKMYESMYKDSIGDQLEYGKVFDAANDIPKRKLKIFEIKDNVINWFEKMVDKYGKGVARLTTGKEAQGNFGNTKGNDEEQSLTSEIPDNLSEIIEKIKNNRSRMELPVNPPDKINIGYKVENDKDKGENEPPKL